MADIRVVPIDRGRVQADMNFVVDNYAVATASNREPTHEYVDFVVWNLVIETPDATVLWDTGSHPEAGDGYWPEPLYDAFAHIDASEHHLEDDLEAAGYALSDIDAVVQSHLHMDHAGGLYEFDGTDVPIYVHEDELPFAYMSAKTTEGSIAHFAPDIDHDLNWQLVHGERTMPFEGLELLHLPGHTPGLLGALIHRDDGTVLVVGDEAYLETNYRDELSMSAGLLWSNYDWFESLRYLKDVERREGVDTLLFGHDLEAYRRAERQLD